MEALTFERAVELAHEVVAEFGEDYVYPADQKRAEDGGSSPSCVYVHENKPSCLVGQILHRHGVDLFDLSKEEFRGAHFVAFHLAGADMDTRQFLDAAQSSQDKGNTWGEAVRDGLKWVEGYYTA